MRLVEHLHIAEIIREAEENRKGCFSSGRDTTVSLSAPGVDLLNLGARGSVSTTLACDAADIRTLAGMQWTHGSRVRKGTGMSSISRPQPCTDLVVTLRGSVIVSAVSISVFSKRVCTSPISRT